MLQAGVALAMGYAGHMQFELIQPTDDHPSVYKEHIDARGYGFHHYGLASADYAGDVDRYLAQGYELAFEAGVPTGGKVGYLDTCGELPGFLKVIEIGPVMEGGVHPLLERPRSAGTAPTRCAHSADRVGRAGLRHQFSRSDDCYVIRCSRVQQPSDERGSMVRDDVTGVVDG